MVYAVLIGLMLTLDLPFIQSQYSHVRGQLTPNKDTLIVRDTINRTEIARLPMRREWTSGIVYPGVFLAETNNARVHLSVYGGKTLTFNDTVTAAKILTNDRYLILGERYGGWTLVNERGQVLRQTRFSDVELLPHHRGLFTAKAGWAEDGEELYELWSASGTKAYDGVFHVLTEYHNDSVSKDSLFCRRGGLLIVLDINGAEISRKTLYRIGDPCRENGFVGRWAWNKVRWHDPSLTKEGEDRRPEPQWSVPFDSAKVNYPIEDRLSIRIDSVTPRLFADKFRAFSVVLKNVSPAPVRLSATHREVPISYQVENEEGNWAAVGTDIMYSSSSTRGYHDVASGDSVLIPIPQFVGETPARFRVRIPYFDTEGRTSEVISESWSGTFNFREPNTRLFLQSYGYLEQIVGYVFAVGDPCNDPWLTTPLDVLPARQVTSVKEAYRTPTIATDSSGTYVPINRRITITMDTVQNILYQNTFKGRMVTITNRSIGLVYIKNIFYEVKVDGSSWQRLDQPRSGKVRYMDRPLARVEHDLAPDGMPPTNRRSYHLGAYASHTAVIPEFAGSTQARFRVRVEYSDLSANNGEVVSAEWEGSINQDFDYQSGQNR
jgi:hypothetical protein